MATVASIVILAALIEALAEYLLGIYWKPWHGETRKKIMNALTLVAGIVVALWANLDILKPVGLDVPILGNILTGTIIGRGSEVVHQFITKYLPK